MTASWLTFSLFNGMWLFAGGGDLSESQGQVAGRGGCPSGDPLKLSVFPGHKEQAAVLLPCF